MLFANKLVAAAATLILATSLTFTPTVQASETCNPALAEVSAENLALVSRLVFFRIDAHKTIDQHERMVDAQLTPQILEKTAENLAVLTRKIMSESNFPPDWSAHEIGLAPFDAELECRGHARDDRGRWVLSASNRDISFLLVSSIERAGAYQMVQRVDAIFNSLENVLCNRPRRQMVRPATIANARLAELLTERAATIFAKLNDPALSEDERSELRLWWEVAYPLFVEADSRLRPLNPELIRTGYDIGHALAIGLWIGVTSGDEGPYLECAEQGARNDLNFRLPLLYGEVLYHRVKRAVEQRLRDVDMAQVQLE